MPYKFGQPWTPVYQDNALLRGAVQAQSRQNATAFFGKPRQPQGQIRDGKPRTLGDLLHDALTTGSRKAGLGKVLADKIATLGNLNPVTQAFDAGADIRNGHYVRGGINALLSAVPDGGGAAAKAMFLGVMAKNADRVAFRKAEQLAATGAPREQIWNETGWFKGADDKWRFEVPDNAASLNTQAMPDPTRARNVVERAEAERLGVRDITYMDPADPARRAAHAKAHAAWQAETDREVPLPEILDHPQLMQAYDLSGLRVGPNPTDGATAAYYPDLNLVRVDNVPVFPRNKYESDLSYRAAKRATLSPLSHEVQHHVQKLEGFARGGMPELGANFQFTPEAIDQYKRMAGEVEARNVQTRLEWDLARRLRTPPWKSQDVPDALQIVKFNR